MAVSPGKHWLHAFLLLNAFGSVQQWLPHQLPPELTLSFAPPPA